MIDEIQVINAGGIPIFYHHKDGHKEDTSYLLQASLITALSQFAKELNNGEIKLISMERKNYLLKKEDNFILIFTSTDEDPLNIIEYENDITKASHYLNEQFISSNLTEVSGDMELYDRPINEFRRYLSDENLIDLDDYDASGFRSEVSNLIFKSVGYEPGKCNIGRAERMKRLAFGMIWFTISFVAFAGLLIYELNPLYRLILIIPNFFGFLGLYQYFYRFCTTNAMKEQYSMN